MLLNVLTCQLEKMLLDIGNDHFEQAKRLNAEIDVQVSCYYVFTIDCIIYANNVTLKLYC